MEKLTKEVFLELNKTKNISEIAEYFNVSRDVINNWRKKNNIITVKNHRQFDVNLLVELAKSGQTLNEICQITGYSRARVSEKLKSIGIKPRRPAPHNKKTIPMEFFIMSEKGFSAQYISQKLNVSDLTVAKWMDENKIQRKRRVSSGELEIKLFLDEITGQNFTSTKSLIDGFEIDLYHQDHNICFEYCGLYWHSEEKRGKQYHSLKRHKCVEKGLTLITIFEDEWLSKKDIVKSIIRNKLGLTQKLFARKLTFQEVNDFSLVRLFLKENHLQGTCNFDRAFALYKEDEIVAVMTYGKHHRNSSKYVLNRLCFKKDLTIVGGASKLFKNSLKLLSVDEIISWCDLRWSEGNVYELLGFEKDQVLNPDYSYFIPNNPSVREHKQKFMKSKINCPKDMTEYQFLKSMNYRRIWDCGKIRYTYKRF